MTGAVVAAMAIPPQIDELTPTVNLQLLELICNILYIIKAITSDVVMVERMIGRDCFPFAGISVRFIPNPKEYNGCLQDLLDVKLIPGEKTVFIGQDQGNDHTDQNRKDRTADNGDSLPAAMMDWQSQA